MALSSEGTALVALLTEQGAEVDLLDLDLNPLRSQRIFGQDRLVLEGADTTVFVVVSAFGAPRALTYSMALRDN